MQRPEGMTSVIILMLIEENPSYGYKIMKKIKKISGCYWCPGQGTVYGAIDKLEDRGYIQPVNPPGEESSEDRNYFGITKNGKEHIEESRKHWENEVKPIDRVLGLLHIYEYFCDEDFSTVLDKIRSEFDSSSG